MQFSLDQFLAKIPQKYIDTYEIKAYSWDIDRVTLYIDSDVMHSIHIPVDEKVTIEIVTHHNDMGEYIEYIIIEHPEKYILKLYDYGNLMFYIN